MLAGPQPSLLLPSPQGKKRGKAGKGGSKPPAKRGAGGGGAAAKKGAGAGSAAAGTPAAGAGSVGLTPGSGGVDAFSLLRSGGAGASTAARPPRPSLAGKTPASTGASLGRFASGTPATAGGGGSGEGEPPASSLRQEAAPRFSSREVTEFPFLHPDRIRDAEGRRPDDPE